MVLEVIKKNKGERKKKENKKKGLKIILKASRGDNREFVGVGIEKKIAKIKSCGFLVVILTTITGDALSLVA
jgi:hypothetical protein